jgi:hypothetical protein
VMTDNGGEFNSDEVKEIISILNIQVCKVTWYTYVNSKNNSQWPIGNKHYKKGEK